MSNVMLHETLICHIRLLIGVLATQLMNWLPTNVLGMQWKTPQELGYFPPIWVTSMQLLADGIDLAKI